MKKPTLNAMASALVVMAVSTPAAYSFELEEIVVTVNKREENLLDVAGSVQVLSADMVQDFKLDDVDAVVDLVPNATFNAAPSGTPVIAIRGLGTRPGSAMLEQDVGLFVDGVWLGRNNQLQAALMDVQTIEVLKGTQATLYGRNTLAGAVSVTTKKPGDELEGYLKVGYEFENDSSTVEGAVSIPVSDKFSLRLAANYEDQDGWVQNTTLDREEPEAENSTVRLTGVYNTDNDWAITGKVQATNKERVGNSFVRSTGEYDGSTEFAPSVFPTPAGVGYDENAAGTQITVPIIDLKDVGTEVDFTDWSLQFDIPLGEHTLTSVTAAGEMELETVFDVFLRTPGPRVIGYFDEDYEQFTQEIRLTSPAGEKLDYIVGLYYVDQAIDRLTFQYVNAADRFWYGEQDMNSWAAFASGTLSISDSVRIIAGARYTDETKEADVIVHGQQEADAEFGYRRETIDETFLNGSVTLEWDATSNALVFAGVAKGTKSPGLADGAAIPTNAQYLASSSLFIPKEEVVTVEVGVKYEMENGYINATLFNMNVSDFQNAAFVNGEIQIGSFDMSIVGLEVDTFHYLTEQVSLSVGLGLLDAENDDTGSDVTSAPEFSANVTLAYETEEWISGFSNRASLNANHKSSHFLNAVSNPNNEIDAVTLFNASLTLSHLASGVDVSLYGKNLTDEEYADFAFGGQAFLGTEHMYSAAQGRTLGLELTFNF
ncbi:TonB-dependent receptor [Pseudomaricurvus alkylphenolicus]|uniref:TonB-dependent receptor n=1 Tax=Pseudomaricurvus alkylphenolicus TaxID=1306991 RepID=UPI00141E87E2|nr:TonB-dependent receptor [Pseudomaricurvus alkylphenolicus]NIB40671.1 TonB-dependent receptor [Pseudomaricurvus alkylphenolicus]